MRWSFALLFSLLWLYTRARHPRNGHSYCSTRGCERVKIIATMSTKQTTCNCTAAAYPKYTKDPSASVPMPAPVTQPCNKCGASKVVIHNTLHLLHYSTTKIVFFFLFFFKQRNPSVLSNFYIFCSITTLIARTNLFCRGSPILHVTSNI